MPTGVAIVNAPERPMGMTADGDPVYASEMDAPVVNPDLPLATVTREANEVVKGTFLSAAQEAAQVIADIARGAQVRMVARGGDEEIRPYTNLQFNAAKYLLEYALGKPTEDGAVDPWEKYLDQLKENDTPADTLDIERETKDAG